MIRYQIYRVINGVLLQHIKTKNTAISAMFFVDSIVGKRLKWSMFASDKNGDYIETVEEKENSFLIHQEYK